MAKVLDYQCPNCNAPLKFNIKSGNWKCDHCDSTFNIEDLNKKKKKDNTELSNNFSTYNCPDCGAQVVCDDTTSATFCIYCGNTNILRNRLEGEFAPSMIIPFKKTKEDAVEAFLGLAKGRPFMPKLFNRKENVEKITGVYIPFWLYDIDISGDYNCDGTRVKTWVVGDTHYTKTDIYKFYRSGKMSFKQIPVDGATKFDNAMMNSIEPFDFNELVPYDHGYLSGFLAEMYDVNKDDSANDARLRSAKTACDKFRASINASTVSNVSDSLDANITKSEYVLLPVWMVNIKYKDEMHLFAMNGETGEIIGNIPLDKRKMFIYTLICFVIFFIIGIVITYLFFKMGGQL